MRFVLGGALSAPPKTNLIATISNAQYSERGSAAYANHPFQNTARTNEKISHG